VNNVRFLCATTIVSRRIQVAMQLYSLSPF